MRPSVLTAFVEPAQQCFRQWSEIHVPFKSKQLPLLLVVVCVLGIALIPGVRFIGAWLVTEDLVTPALASVVFGGQVPFRAMQAAALYNDGTVKEVWLTQGDVTDEDRKLIELGIARPAEFEFSRRVLVRLGVPESVIHILPGENVNTADEVRTIVREVRRRSSETGVRDLRVILVTSKAHSRRVKTLWRLLAPDGTTALVKFAKEDPYEPEGWWKTTSDASQVAHEWFGLLNAWAGFPLASKAR